MAMQTLRGTVEEITISREPAFGKHYNEVLDDIIVKVTMGLEDGRKAYLKTKIGYFHDFSCGGGGPIVSVNWADCDECDALKENRPTWGYWRNEDTIHHSERFNVGVAELGRMPTPAVWRDDVIEIRGSVSEKISGKGNAYLSVNRLKLLSITRAS